MDFNRAKRKLADGYCLWVGAGVTKQLWQGALQWDELTKKLEDLADLAADQSAPYPERLQLCSEKLGADEFRKWLRKIYYTELCEAMLRRAARSLGENRLVPPEAYGIAALGQLANPIVSFNIEPFSSTLLSRPAGPARIIPFIKPQTPRIEFRELVKAFQRIVYHPHGLSTADCIITKEQYDTLNGTLALKLAGHAAFGNHLAIVGMSLQDDYLREQISEFRNQIGSILWFNNRFGDLAIWAMCNKVDLVQVEWSEFWEKFNPADVPPEHLTIAWYRLVCEAAEEMAGGRAHLMAKSIPDAFLSEKMFAESARIGEPGKLRLVDDQDPSDILRKLRDQLQAKAIRIPASIQQPAGSLPVLEQRRRAILVSGACEILPSAAQPVVARTDRRRTITSRRCSNGFGSAVRSGSRR
ncbi:MAG TPA: SIR2 family protein [Chthoniobacterales bacterium]|jgi:hypothetical protein|nr:SIR2 family protein [Chthoniobacterales bacterium]